MSVSRDFTADRRREEKGNPTMTSIENVAHWTVSRDDARLMYDILYYVDVVIERNAEQLGENFPYDIVSTACDEIRCAIADTEIVDVDVDDDTA
jgi:hypothetical protein